MRPAILAATAVLLTTFCLTTGAASAMTEDEICKDGQMTTIRLNVLKGPEAKPTFGKAVRDHLGWFRKRGGDDNRLLVGTVVTYDGAAKSWSEVPNEMMTIHIQTEKSDQVREKRDAEWDAYVGEYRASSTVGFEKTVCLREPVK